MVVDTNVIVVADERHEQATDACTARCQARLHEIMQSGCVIVDDRYLILGEYGKQFTEHAGQPTVGSAFYKWLLQRQGVASCCQRVSLTAGKGEHVFTEYPDLPALADFDPPDRKFIAVAAAHPERPAILQALDSKWWGLREAFEQAGLTIEFLCEDQISDIYAKKFP